MAGCFRLFPVIALAVAGCATTKALPSGAVEAPDRKMPPWVLEASAHPGCTSNMSCAIGSSSGVEHRDQAVRAARYSGFVSLAGLAFPVDIVQQYRDERRIDGDIVSESISADLAGRLTGAEVLDEFWVKRRVHSIDGYREVFDGWALVAIDTVTLKSLYGREKARSRTEAAEIAQRISESTRLLASDTLDAQALVRGLSLWNASSSQLASLQDTPEKTAAITAQQDLSHVLSNAIDIRVLESIPNVADSEVTLQLEVVANGDPVPSLALTRDDRCVSHGTGSIVSDAEGRFAATVRYPARRESCEVALRFTQMPSLVRRIQLGPLLQVEQVSATVDFQGVLGGNLAAAVRDRVTSLAQTFSRRGHVSMSAAGPAHVQVQVRGRLNNPTHRNSRLLTCGGEFFVDVNLFLHGRIVMTRSSGPKPLRLAGLDNGQLVAGAAAELLRVVETFISEVDHDL